MVVHSECWYIVGPCQHADIMVHFKCWHAGGPCLMPACSDVAWQQIRWTWWTLPAYLLNIPPLCFIVTRITCRRCWLPMILRNWATLSWTWRHGASCGEWQRFLTCCCSLLTSDTLWVLLQLILWKINKQWQLIALGRHRMFNEGTQQETPTSPMVTFTWHTCKCNVHKLHQSYIYP